MTKIIIGIVIAIIILGGVYFYLSKKPSSAPSPVPAETSVTTTPPVTVPVATPVTTQTIDQNTITLTVNGFSPIMLTVPVGTKVTWINNSSVDATVNSNPHPVHTDYAPLNLGSFPDGGTLSLIFDKPGTYSYHNHLVPSQSGTIVVQ